MWLNSELILLKVFEDNFTDVAFGNIVVVIYSKVEAFSRQNFEANLGGKFLRQKINPCHGTVALVRTAPLLILLFFC